MQRLWRGWVVGHEYNMAIDLWDNTRTLQTKGRCEPNDISEAFITTSGEQVWPDLPNVSVNSRFGGN